MELDRAREDVVASSARSASLSTPYGTRRGDLWPVYIDRGSFNSVQAFTSNESHGSQAWFLKPCILHASYQTGALVSPQSLSQVELTEFSLLSLFCISSYDLVASVVSLNCILIIHSNQRGICVFVLMTKFLEFLKVQEAINSSFPHRSPP